MEHVLIRNYCRLILLQLRIRWKRFFELQMAVFEINFYNTDVLLVFLGEQKFISTAGNFKLSNRELDRQGSLNFSRLYLKLTLQCTAG